MESLPIILVAPPGPGRDLVQAALAEVQLLLMDGHPPEMQESLETTQEQFRRLRDMVADLSRLRVPRRPTRRGPAGCPGSLSPAGAQERHRGLTAGQIHLFPYVAICHL